MSAERRLGELGIDLPPPRQASANFVRTKQVGNILYVSGQGPSRQDGSRVTVKVGSDLTLDEGYRAARLVGIGILSTVRDAHARTAVGVPELPRGISVDVEVVIEVESP